ncbi:hypothetical protein A0J61_06940 [Choanephora cucurbitarum]|uniref:Uncharacterized protein n=1 Tax=Choanephora cucurbitarum TaxID=101091 RepID=A0A1C7N7Q7_9FUNG|nr:hypothetical protein A0J61_06940 [Choanephora cucurbitarum]
MDLLQRQQVVGDPMYLKACEMACKLLDASESLSVAVNQLQQAIENTTPEDSVHAPLRKAIDQYEHLLMINNVLKAIYPSVQNVRHQQYLESATVSATNTSNHQLSKVYQLVSNSRLNNDDRVQQELIYISRQIQSIVEQESVKQEVMDYTYTQANEALRSTASPVQRNTPPIQMQVTSPIQRLQSAPLFPSLQTQPPVSVSQQGQSMITPQASVIMSPQQTTQPVVIHSNLMQPTTAESSRQHIMSATTSVQPIVTVVSPQMEKSAMLPSCAASYPNSETSQQTQHSPDEFKREQTEPHQHYQQTEGNSSQTVQTQQSESFLASRFLEQFEATATEFAELNKIHVNSVWESMIVHALPSSQSEWAHEHLLGKDYTWEKAKQIFKKHFLESSRLSPPMTPADPNATLMKSRQRQAKPEQLSQQGTALQKVKHEKQYQQASGPTNGASANSVTYNRTAVYAEHLFSLEMKLYENIDAYNTRYLRYCNIANMDLCDVSLMQRYAKSLLKDYRKLIHTNISGKAIQTLPKLMELTSAIIKDYEGKHNTKKTVAPYSCPNDHSTLSSISFLSQKNQGNNKGPGPSNSRKRPTSFAEANTASKRPTIF